MRLRVDKVVPLLRLRNRRVLQFEVISVLYHCDCGNSLLLLRRRLTDSLVALAGALRLKRARVLLTHLQVALIHTEQLLLELTVKELQNRGFQHEFQGRCTYLGCAKERFLLEHYLEIVRCH